MVSTRVAGGGNGHFKMLAFERYGQWSRTMVADIVPEPISINIRGAKSTILAKIDFRAFPACRIIVFEFGVAFTSRLACSNCIYTQFCDLTRCGMESASHPALRYAEGAPSGYTE